MPLTCASLFKENLVLSDGTIMSSIFDINRCKQAASLLFKYSYSPTLYNYLAIDYDFRLSFQTGEDS